MVRSRVQLSTQYSLCQYRQKGLAANWLLRVWRTETNWFVGLSVPYECAERQCERMLVMLLNAER